MKIALYSHNWENPLVRKELATCDLVYTSDANQYPAMVEAFGHHVVKVITDCSMEIVNHIRQFHQADCDTRGETVRFVDHARVAALVRASKPRMIIASDDKLTKAQRDLTWLDQHRHYAPEYPGRPAHSSWLLIGPEDCTLAKAISTLRPPGFYCELDAATQQADLVRMEWLDSIGYFQPQNGSTPAFTTWMLATAGEVTLRQAIDRMIGDEVKSTLRRAA